MVLPIQAKKAPSDERGLSRILLGLAEFPVRDSCLREIGLSALGHGSLICAFWLCATLAKDGLDVAENGGSLGGVEFHDLPDENGG